MRWLDCKLINATLCLLTHSHTLNRFKKHKLITYPHSPIPVIIPMIKDPRQSRPNIKVSVDQAGPERTEAGESAPSRLEDSPRPGRAKCELCETLQDLIMGAGEEASLNLPCLLILASSWIARPSRSYSSELQATRGTLCCSAILPF